MANEFCRYFTGYKPCLKNPVCDQSCKHADVPKVSLLIIHLGALGAVVRSTALLKAIKRKYPGSMITWVTDAPAQQLLAEHPGIDRVLTTHHGDIIQLAALEFDVAFVIDKSLKATGILNKTQVGKTYGFQSRPENGAIVPATRAADELWSLGLDNYKKFYVNKKSEIQLVHEALELGPYVRDNYWLPLSSSEKKEVTKRRNLWLSAENKEMLIGINTGCSSVIPYKKLSIDYHRKMILKISDEIPGAGIVLLGGPEDQERNNLISNGLNVISSPVNLGLRDGLVSVASCDVVVTGDSLGMHMAISQKINVVAWFGPTCSHEIDLFDRGTHVLTKSSCSPCWKRACEKSEMCYDQVSLEELLNAIKSYSSNSVFGRPSIVDSPSKENASALA
jgi:heptosyltransferase-2